MWFGSHRPVIQGRNLRHHCETLRRGCRWRLFQWPIMLVLIVWGCSEYLQAETSEWIDWSALSPDLTSFELIHHNRQLADAFVTGWEKIPQADFQNLHILIVNFRGTFSLSFSFASVNIAKQILFNYHCKSLLFCDIWGVFINSTKWIIFFRQITLIHFAEYICTWWKLGKNEKWYGMILLEVVTVRKLLISRELNEKK